MFESMHDENDKMKSTLEQLETRLLLTSYVVDTTVDESDGDYSAGDLSLREAIELANADATGDTITFAASVFGGGETIGLTSGSLNITEDLTVIGNTNHVIEADYGARVFSIDNAATVTISSLTISQGAYSGDGGQVRVGNDSSLVMEAVTLRDGEATRGGAIFADTGSHLELRRSVITYGLAENAGAIFTVGNSLILEDTTISSQYANLHGGGVYADGLSQVLIKRTRFHDNAVTGVGGAVYAKNITDLSVISSAFDLNSSFYQGGAIFAKNVDSLALVNSTISGNTSYGEGAGIAVENVTGLIINSTITDNTVYTNYEALGGGLAVDNYSAVTLRNTIIADNYAYSDYEIHGTVTGSHNLIGEDDSSGGLLDGVNGNIVGNNGVGTFDLSAVLSATLSDQGNGLPVHLLIGGVAVDGGSDVNLPLDSFDIDGDLDVSEALPWDQTGLTRLEGAAVDIGAVEYRNYPPIDLDLLTTAVLDNAPDGTVIGTVAVADGNSDDTHRFILLDNAGGRFAIDEVTGEVTVLDGSLLDATQDNLHDLTVQVEDSGGVTFQETFEIAVVLSGAAPHDLSLDNLSIAENSPARTILGTLTVSDVDPSPPDTHTFSLINEYGYFDVDSATGVVTAEGRIPLNHEYNNGERSLRVKVTDRGGRFYVELFTIQITDIQEAPTSIRLSSNRIDERAANGSDVATIFISDDDVGDTHALELLDDAGGRFRLTGNRLYVQDRDLLDYEQATSHDIQVRATDSAGLSLTSTLTIYIDDVFDDALIVDTLIDENDGDYSAGDLSLREAIALSGIYYIENSITFDATVFAGDQTITLDGDELQISNDLQIDGLAQGVTIDAVEGSRVFSIQNATVGLSNLTLTGGNADHGGAIRQSGGKLTLEGVSINANQATNGGGLHAEGAAITIRDSVIQNNQSEFGAGLYQDEGTLAIQESVFRENVAQDAGAGIFVNDAVGAIDQSDFRSNQSDDGGAIYTSHTTLTLSEVIIAGNEVSGSGAGIYIKRGSLAVSGATINENRANYQGAGLYFSLSTVTITDSSITENESGSDGGGIRGSGTLSISNSTIVQNRADDGGGMLVSGGVLNLTQSTISGNYSDGVGGAIYLSGSSGTISDTTITGNEAGGSGAGLYARDSEMVISVSMLSENRAGSGGGVSLSQGTLTLSDSYVIDNKADHHGGGFYIGNAVVDLDNVSVHGNDAGDSGGGLYVLNGSLMLENVEISGNVAGDDGGAIFVGGAATILDSRILNNQAHRGGGIYNRDKIYAIRSEIAWNEADYGGGIYQYGYGDDIELFGSTVNDNVAFERGGGLDVNGGALYLTNSTISQNASAIGSGLYADGDSLYLNSSTIVRNSESGMVLSDVRNLVMNNTIVAGHTTDISGDTVEGSNNLVGDANSSGGLTDGIDGNIVGVAGVGVRAIETVLNTNLHVYGDGTPTHTLVNGSVAIDGGDASLLPEDAYDPDGDGDMTEVLSLDQNLVARVNGALDIGATEFRRLPPVVMPGEDIEFLEHVAAFVAKITDPNGDAISYSINGGADSSLFSLNNEGELYFSSSPAVPDFEVPLDHDADNIYEIDIQIIEGANVWDKSLRISVIDNLSPQILNDSGQLIENRTGVVFTPEVNDPEDDSLVFSLGGPDAIYFDMSHTGELTFVSPPDYESPQDQDADNVYVVILGVSDGEELVTQTVSIEVLNDQQPVITSASTVEVLENTDTYFYELAYLDPDNAHSDLDVVLLAGDDTSLFEIDSSDRISFASSPDFENPLDNDLDNIYRLHIGVSDGENLEAFILDVTVLDNQAPVITSASEIIVPENLIPAHRFSVTDSDDSSTRLTHAISGVDSEHFWMDSIQRIHFREAPDFESPADANSDNIYELIYSVSDIENTVHQTVTISVTDISGGGQTYVVDTLLDENDGDHSVGDLSLREAIGLANHDSELDVIIFDETVFAGGQTITLGGTDIDIRSALEIQGISHSPITIDANAQSGHFYVNRSKVKLESLVLTNGRNRDGGAVKVLQGDITFDNMTVSGNTATQYGGGIAAHESSVRILSSRLSENQLEGDFTYGGALYLDEGYLEFSNSEARGNVGAFWGGGIYTKALDVSVSSSQIIDNVASRSGGGMYLLGENTKLSNLIIENNRAYSGGGIYATEDMKMINSTLADNLATNGGGVYYRSRGNHRAIIINSTLSGNRASEDGGAFYLDTFGDVEAALDLDSSTVVLNSADRNGGALAAKQSSRTDINSYNTIIAGNSALNDDGFGRTLADGRNNIVGDASSSGGLVDGVDGNIVGNNGVGTLDVNTVINTTLFENSMGVMTHALVASSPAIGAGDPSALPVDAFDLDGDLDFTELIPFDQHGNLRQLNGLDIGAVEFERVSPVILAGDLIVDEQLTSVDGFHVYDGDNDIVSMLLTGVDKDFFELNANGRLSFKMAPDFENPLDADGDNRYDISVSVTDPNGTVGSDYVVEVRDLLDTFTIDTLLDESDGDYSAGDLSLREAIELANSFTHESDITFDPVVFAGGKTIRLNGDQLEVTGRIHIQADPGAVVTIDANRRSRVMLIESVSTRLSNLVITGGQAYDAFGGGLAVVHESVVHLQNVSVVGNRTYGSGGYGGGVFVSSGADLSIDDSVIRNNLADDDGGGIYARYADLIISNTSIQNNFSYANGGGLIQLGGTLQLRGVTISGNTSNEWGGGGYLSGSSTLAKNITVSGNRSAEYGGGLLIISGSAELANATIANNQADSGGGLLAADTSVYIHNSIVIGNEANTNDDLGGGLRGTYSLIGVASGSDLIRHGQDGNIVGVNNASEVIDLELRDNGGPTLTHAIAGGSLAVDNGFNQIVNDLNLTTDQRGEARIVNGIVDIGAVESLRLISISDSQISEDSVDGDIVGSLSVVDSSRGESGWIYRKQSGDSFVVDSAGLVRITNSHLLDHDTSPFLELLVEAEHSSGFRFVRAVWIHVTNVNESPAGLLLDSNEVSEGASNGTLIGTLAVVDEDVNDSHTYRLLNQTSRLAVGAIDGRLTVAGQSQLDYESEPSFPITVEVRDSGGLTYRETFTINVTDANDAPGNLNLDQSVIPFGARSGASIGTVSASDQDLGDTLTYSIIRDDDSLFEINASTGELSLRQDIGLIQSTFLIVRVTDQLGAFSNKRFNFTVEKASGEISRVNLPARGIQGVTFKGSVNAKLLNDSGRDWNDLSHMDLKLVARPTGGGADRVLAARDYKGKLQRGKSKSVSFNFSSSLPAGGYRILVIASYQAPGDPEAVTLIAAEDKSSNPQLLSVDSGAHTDLTTETELGSKLPASHPEGERLKVKLKVHVRNDGNVEMPAAVTSLHVFLEDSLGTRHGPPLFVNPNLKLSKMKPGQVKAVNVSFDMPADTALGDFHFAVDIDGLNRITETNEAGTAESNNSSRTSETILIEESYLDLRAEIGDRKGVRTYSAGKAIKDSRSLRVGNQGNVATAKSALANLRIEIYDALDQLVDTQLIENVKLGNLKPGKSKNVAARMSFDPLTVGDYRTVYTLEPVNFTDTDLSDNTFEHVFRVR